MSGLIILHCWSIWLTWKTGHVGPKRDPLHGDPNDPTSPTHSQLHHIPFDCSLAQKATIKLCSQANYHHRVTRSKELSRPSSDVPICVKMGRSVLLIEHASQSNLFFLDVTSTALPGIDGKQYYGAMQCESNQLMAASNVIQMMLGLGDLVRDVTCRSTSEREQSECSLHPNMHQTHY